MLVGVSCMDGLGGDTVNENEEFSVFWSDERDRLCRVLTVAVGDPQLAAEAVDEAMARALERWGIVGSYDDPTGWVLRVARNWATSWHRKWKRRPTRPVQALDRAETDSVPDVDVLDALHALPELDRLLLGLRYGLDWPVGRVAAALEMPEGTVKSRVSRVLQRLRDQQEALR